MWPTGSLEEYVQNLVKTWEMELIHKANLSEYKTLDPEKFVLGVNGTLYFLGFKLFLLAQMFALSCVIRRDQIA